MVLQVMVEVVLVLGKSASPPKIYILEEKGIMGGFRRLRGFLVLLLEVVKMVCVLGSYTLPPKKLVVGLMVVTFSSSSRDYSSMCHSCKERYYYSSKFMMEDHYVTASDDEDAIGPSVQST